LLPTGSLIDQSFLDENNAWRWTATAAESAGLTAIRGRALKLIRNELPRG
jgi:hypothetical protein